MPHSHFKSSCNLPSQTSVPCTGTPVVCVLSTSKFFPASSPGNLRTLFAEGENQWPRGSKVMLASASSSILLEACMHVSSRRRSPWYCTFFCFFLPSLTCRDCFCYSPSYSANLVIASLSTQTEEILSRTTQLTPPPCCCPLCHFGLERQNSIDFFSCFSRSADVF